MGLDFIRRTAKGFTKTWDRSCTSLAEPSLFARYPETRTRTVIAELQTGCQTKVGDELAICFADDQLILVAETIRIGFMKDPPPDLVAAVCAAGGYALARIKQLNPLSGTADVEVE